ncbi:2-phospho-L-lactate guanylyltransferase [Amycolatopsis rhabdoformis]|uniref:Phosphoenolpyruvate guanylyltransferase n=1 Tax=Amycolatopsis rhabdoformis TaxID=1448059 RepID=A0ABZ1I9U9_9PSEU|nr:2-phospho-L-lactate guanylyltransferase [Amycolatopsis rhabdoformis]WSE30205.1 2-phospho-L-lactate guanylyltransferase [Amycolatopsis rhabdoformis]
MDVDLVVPLKHPRVGKSRLRGALVEAEHAELVLALAYDTLAAVTSVAGVRRVLVVAADPGAVADLAGLGVELVTEPDGGGLNEALRHGAALLRDGDPHGVVGALQADLPALRAGDFAAALAEAAGRRAFVADHQGTGTTLLLSAPGAPLDPRFGAGSAQRHTDSGAVALAGAMVSLRSDVDTSDDLSHVRALGVGKRTAALLPDETVTLS